MQLDPAAAAGAGEQQQQQQDEAQQQYAAWLSRQYSTFTGQLLQLCTASSSASLQVWPVTLCRPELGTAAGCVGETGVADLLAAAASHALYSDNRHQLLLLAQQHRSTAQQVPAGMLT